MKLQDFAYNIVMKTLEVLETEYNYKIAENVKKEIVETVVRNMDSLISK